MKRQETEEALAALEERWKDDDNKKENDPWWYIIWYIRECYIRWWYISAVGGHDNHVKTRLVQRAQLLLEPFQTKAAQQGEGVRPERGGDWVGEAEGGVGEGGGGEGGGGGGESRVKNSPKAFGELKIKKYSLKSAYASALNF